MSLKDRLQGIEERIARALERAGRGGQEARVVWVTKGIPLDRMEEAYRLGLREFGENRVQEWRAKRSDLPEDIRWHLIGTLQSNKAKFLDASVALFHALDRPACLHALEKVAGAKAWRVPVLIEVNASGEATKSGVSPSELARLVEDSLRSPHVDLRGLMTMAPMGPDEQTVRGTFQTLRELSGEMSRRFGPDHFQELSMGMSSDFELALEEGATCLRIGQALFVGSGVKS